MEISMNCEAPDSGEVQLSTVVVKCDLQDHLNDDRSNCINCNRGSTIGDDKSECDNEGELHETFDESRNDDEIERDSGNHTNDINSFVLGFEAYQYTTGARSRV
uniref:Uncharacterized protein n=1 Tax=Amphimedon queenslandica TaxID=400682 RepID=A0A1X7UIX9_AMPQE